MVKKSKKNRYSGLATVEAALVLPILLILTFGVIEYGWLFLKAQQTTNAARCGARIAVRAYATTGDVETQIDLLMAMAGMEGKFSKVIGNIGVDTGESVNVQITVPTANIVIMNMPFWLPVPENIIASVTMSKEGP